MSPVLGLLLAAALGAADFRPTPAHPVGFRGDWTGRYTGAQPPLHWSPTNNVAWKTEVGVGESSPVVVGNRIFILTDGVRIRCLDRRDGAVLWERDRHLRADVPVEAALLPVEDYVRRYHQWCAGKGKGAHWDVARRELGEPPATVSCGGQPNRYWSQSPLAYAIATPCSDGRNLYVWLPTGVLVAYDLEGHRQWTRVLGDQRVGGGWWGAHVAPSPLLADGKLVVHYDKIYCVEAATGNLLWTQNQRVLPIPSPVAGQAGGEWCVALGTLQILRLRDGQYVHGDERGGHHDSVGVGSPVFFEGMVSWTSHTVALPAATGGEAKLAWELDADTAGKMTQYNHVPRPATGKPYHLRGMGWHGYASPVVHDGRFYYHHEGALLSALDAATGAWQWTKQLKDGHRSCGGAVYPSLTLAGPCLYATGGGGVTFVMRVGAEPEFQIVAVNQLDDLGGNALVFSGRDLFAHAGRWLYCIREETNR